MRLCHASTRRLSAYSSLRERSWQAALDGVPIITLDPLSPAWPVSCHDFSAFDETISGSACRPSRDQWLANMAYMTWNTDDIASGEAIKFLLDF